MWPKIKWSGTFCLDCWTLALSVCDTGDRMGWVTLAAVTHPTKSNSVCRYSSKTRICTACTHCWLTHHITVRSLEHIVDSTCNTHLRHSGSTCLSLYKQNKWGSVIEELLVWYIDYWMLENIIDTEHQRVLFCLICFGTFLRSEGKFSKLLIQSSHHDATSTHQNNNFSFLWECCKWFSASMQRILYNSLQYQLCHVDQNRLFVSVE